jgi:hypothetical protein
MSHGRRAVRYQCPSRDDESNDYVESEGQCGPYQEPQGFGKVPEHSGTFCMRPDPNGHWIGVTSCDAKAVGSHVPSEFRTSIPVPSASD